MDHNKKPTTAKHNRQLYKSSTITWQWWKHTSLRRSLSEPYGSKTQKSSVAVFKQHTIHRYTSLSHCQRPRAKSMWPQTTHKQVFIFQGAHPSCSNLARAGSPCSAPQGQAIQAWAQLSKGKQSMFDLAKAGNPCSISQGEATQAHLPKGQAIHSQITKGKQLHRFWLPHQQPHKR